MEQPVKVSEEPNVHSVSGSRLYAILHHTQSTRRTIILQEATYSSRGRC